MAVKVPTKVVETAAEAEAAEAALEVLLAVVQGKTASMAVEAVAVEDRNTALIY